MSVMHLKQEQQAAEAEHGRERAHIGLGRLDRLKEAGQGERGASSWFRLTRPRRKTYSTSPGRATNRSRRAINDPTTTSNAWKLMSSSTGETSPKQSQGTAKNATPCVHPRQSW